MVGIGNLHTSGWFAKYPLAWTDLEDGLPLVPDEILDTVVYLYPDHDSAKAGERAGGSGFVVVVPVQQDPMMGFMYIVTNSHVIREGKAFAIRVNTRDGGMGIIDLTEKGWIYHRDGDDIAILPINLEHAHIKAKGIPIDWFATKEYMERYKIGPGDETFLVGRFVNHEGKQRNLPSVRFGNLSMLPHEPVRTPRGLLQEVFLVECRSLPGYSGSPVFIAPLPLSAFRNETPPTKLLGIDMGHLLDDAPVLSRKALAQQKKVAINDDWVVKSNTGMSCVIPAWKIQELIDEDELVESRKKHIEKFEKQEMDLR